MTTLILIHLMLMPVGLAFLFLVWPESKKKEEKGLGMKPDFFTTFLLHLAMTPK